jgi:predicted transcriptional regulator
MKRSTLVEKLIKEGMSEKTLVRFTDKQLLELSERMLGEADIMISKKDPMAPQKIADAKKKNQSIETYEEELKGGQKKLDKNHNGKIDGQDFKILQGQKKKEVSEEKPSAGLSKEKKSEVVKKAKKGGDIGNKGKGFEKLASKAAKEYGSKEKGEKVAAASMWKNIKKEGEEIKEWVEKLVENKYHSFTSKNEIMELISVKLNESDTMVQHGPKVKKGHNGVPEFMTYDSIVDAAEPKTAPTTKPAPTKEPGTKPTPNKDPRKTPFKPGPGPNPKPKALKENKKSK